MREKKPKLASFVLIGLMLASIFAGAISGAGVGGAEEEIDYPIVSNLKAQSADNPLTIALTPVADVTVKSWQPDTNFGSEDILELSYSAIDEVREAVTLLRFDVASVMPEGAIIDSAVLELFLVDGAGADPALVAAHFVTSNWAESSVTWNSFPTAEPIGIISQVDRSPGSYKSWQVTSFARVWQSGSNNGIYLRGPVDGTYYERTFESREHMERVPRLIVTYHLPSPAYTFTGNVYQGSLPDTSTPAGGVTVGLWSDEDEWPEAGSARVLLASTTTDDAGEFSLSWEEGDSLYPYHHVIEVDPPGAYSTGAQAEEPGYVKNSNVVSYLDIPLGTYGGIAFWDQLPEEKPDLNITNVWNGDGRICYHIQNIGEGVAPGGHCTALSVDGVYRVEDCVEEDLAPGVGMERCFEYGWECTPPEDVIRVCADHRGEIEERDEENNCVERIFECAPEEKPDLIITDVRSEARTICYQIRNIGEAEAPGGHYTALFVDDEYRVSDLVDKGLEPGERWKGCFDYEWVCTPPEDIIAVAADYEEDVAEDNKTNNRREEIWNCDTTAPEITHGPTVHEVTQNSAVIFWETNEDSDSVVKYGKTARMYASEETDSTMVREHIITLSGLEPSTTYNFVVQSTDPGRNSVQSKDKTLATLPLSDDEDPTVSIIDPGVCQGTVTISAEASDNIGVEKVEFFFGEKLVFTDFLEEQSYRLAKLRLDTTKYENGEYTLKAKAYDLSGRYAIDERIIRILNIIDVTAPSVNITSPSQGDTVSGKINITADLSDDTGMDAAGFYVDGVKNSVESFPPNTTSKTVHFSWDTTYLKKRTYRIVIRAWDMDGKNGTDTVDVMVDNPPIVMIQPHLTVAKHEVTRHQHGFTVELTVKNVGLADATNVYIKDFLRSFQPISRSTMTPVLATYEAEFQGASWTSSMYGVCKITDYTDIPAGQSHTYTFGAIPVLFYPMSPAPSIGEIVEISYEGKDGTKLYEQFKNNKVLSTKGNEPIGTAYKKALKEADYLIMTNPYRLFSLPDSANVDDLLSEMAQLAVYNKGVLGYAYTQSELKIKKLITPGDEWAKKLSSDFSKPLEGYLLIVGETEIVPAWTSNLSHHWGPIKYSDHSYADTDDNGVPDLIVGRIIGDDAANLTKPIQASIGVHEKSHGYAFARNIAVVMSDPGKGPFVQTVEFVANKMLQTGFKKVREMHFRDYFIVSSFYRNYEQHDGFAVGDVLGDTKDDIIIGDGSTDKIYIYDEKGIKLKEFYCGFGENEFEKGDRIAVGNSNIVMADSSANRILIYNGYGVLQSSFPLNFEAFDGLAVGDVTGDDYDEIVIADRSAGKIYVYTIGGTKLSEFKQDYEIYDGFAVGDVRGTKKEEIIVADISKDEIYIFKADGTPFGSFERKGGFDEGDGIVVGNVTGGGKDQILVADTSVSRIYIHRWNSITQKWDWGGEIPLDDLEGYDGVKGYDGLEGFEGFATGDIGDKLQTHKEEVMVACRDNNLRIFDTTRNWIGRIQDDLPGKILEADVIYFQGHGGPGAWDAAINSYLRPGHLHEDEAVFPLDFNSHNPFVLATTCYSGNYQDPSGGPWGGPEDKNIAESFLASGAAVYIGSTQVSAICLNREFGKAFFEEWGADESIGEAFTDMEKARWHAKGGWKYFITEYNLYGDPKFGRVIPPSAGKVSKLAESSKPLSSLQVEIPNYVVNEERFGDGLDSVEIPGGHLWYEAGQLWVPFYSTSIDYPIGYEIQDVVLTDRFGLVTDTGLNIPMTPLTINPSVWDPIPYSGTIDGWFPEEDYHWESVENPDGTTTLVIIMYPFYYNPLTTDVRFYKNYSFDINYSISSVEITKLETDKRHYVLDPVSGKVEFNDGEPGKIPPVGKDVIILAYIKRYGSDEFVDGLPLRTLKDLRGKASYYFKWDHSGFEPGYYTVEVELKDSDGNLLDRQTEMFRLGISSGEITNFTATPEYFEIGGDIGINIKFNNTGTVNITGDAVTKIINSTGYVVEEFRHNVTDLTPSESISLTDTWNTSGAEEGSYNIIGYVLYDSKATDPMTVTIYSCVTPIDDLYINADTTLCPGVYNIPDSGAEGVIIINASNVVLDCNGAIINGTMTGSDYGIYSRDYDNVTIKNCNVMNYQHGIELEMSSNSTITHNELSFNRYGIYLFSSDDSIVTNNNANSNKYKGIGLQSSSNNLVTNNNANANGDGIFLGPRSSNNKIEGNNASSNKQVGIYIYGDSSSNIFSNNEITDNLYGIYLSPCICPTCSHYCPGGNFNNTIKVNEILNNEIGIFSNQSNSMIDVNIVCDNIESDFNSSNWLSSSGDNNTCDKPNGWNDAGTTGCTYTCPIEKQDLKIRDLKGPDWSNYVGKEVTVEGIFVRDPLPMLVTDLDIVRVNMPMPDDQYILLIGNEAEEIDPRSCGGAKLRLKGLVAEIDDTSKYGDEYVAIETISYEMLERLEEYAPEIIYIVTYPEQ